jgi:triacylglycerol esterase/lipase EstA (alpha/beta hydrolase family)
MLMPRMFTLPYVIPRDESVLTGLSGHSSASAVLAAVRTGLSKYNTNKVALTGHSLGTYFAFPNSLLWRGTYLAIA